MDRSIPPDVGAGLATFQALARLCRDLRWRGNGELGMGSSSGARGSVDSQFSIPDFQISASHSSTVTVRKPPAAEGTTSSFALCVADSFFINGSRTNAST